MRTRIDRRENVNSEEGERKYGNVAFANTTPNTYSINTPEHTRTSWRSIHHWENSYTFISENQEVTNHTISRVADQASINIKK